MTYPHLSTRQDPHTFVTEYLAAYPDDVLVVDETVPVDQGVTGLIYELTARGHDEMLLCRNLDRVDVPIVSNVFASRTRIGRMLGVGPSGLHEAYARRSAAPQPPRVVESGPVLSVTQTGEEVNLDTVPMLRHFASDRAAYITSGIVIAEDPDTGVGNMSYHRSMVHTRRQLATSLHSRGDLWRMLQKYAERGEPMPVAMVVGGHPLFMLAASARVGYEVDERAIAGGLLGEPLEVVPTPTYGIKVPAWSDLVLEGTIDPDASADEGPFGEFSGYSSNRSTNNVLDVVTITRRQDPLLIDVEGGNTAEHLNLARIPRESEIAGQLKARFPDVTAVYYPTSGTHFHCYVALRQRRAGQARQVMLAVLGWDPYVKTVIAVDDDIDVTSDADVLWSLATHFQPHRDLLTVDGLPGSPLDPSAGSDGVTSRMGLDATRGPGFEGQRIEISEQARAWARRVLDGDDRERG